MTTRIDPQELLGRVSFYLAGQYPFIKNDCLRQTPERRACEIILVCKDLIELTTKPTTNPRRNRFVDHIDGDPCNNDPSNLRIVTLKENRR